MRRPSRREFVLGSAAAAVGAAIGTKWLVESRGTSPVHLPSMVPSLPERQHAWEAFSDLDEFGNTVPPKFHRLLLADVEGEPGSEHRFRLEAALRTLEADLPWSSKGLLFTIGWSSAYFDGLPGRPTPLPPARSVSPIDDPTLDAHQVCLHIASDDETRLADIEASLTGDAPPKDTAGVLDLSGVLRITETRTGFVGPGIPASRQNVAGIPPGRPVPEDAPLFMGFRSGFRQNQATEDDVTIATGTFAGGTTMRVTRFRLALDSWYRLLDREQRVDRMFSPALDASQVEALTDEAPTHADQLVETARSKGVIGHLQATAGARRDGRPRILRRDFDTTDGGRAGLHFVALQREIADFEATRIAMDANEAQPEHAAIGPRVNNGINEFIIAVNEANYLIPPRRMRSFPLLPST